MRVLAAGACAAAGRAAAAPSPSAAMPPARKLRRAGIAGKRHRRAAGAVAKKRMAHRLSRFRHGIRS